MSAQTSEFTAEGFTVRVIRSARRKRTVSARLINWRTIEVRAPSDLPADELERVVTRLVSQVRAKQAHQRARLDEPALLERARELNRRYFGGKLQWRSISYVANQHKRWGSCSPQQGTLRLSERLREVPLWVLDYVLMHELAHLLEPRHNAAFWVLVNRYPKSERARGYLMALQLDDSEAPEDNA